MGEYTTTGNCAVHGKVAFIPHHGGHDCFRCVAALEEITSPQAAPEAVVRLDDLLTALIGKWDKAEDKAHKDYERFGNLNAAGRGTAYGICAEELRVLIKRAFNVKDNRRGHME